MYFVIRNVLKQDLKNIPLHVLLNVKNSELFEQKLNTIYNAGTFFIIILLLLEGKWQSGVRREISSC